MTQEKEIEDIQKQFAKPNTVNKVINSNPLPEKAITPNSPQGKCPIQIKCEDGKSPTINFKESYRSQKKDFLQELTATEDAEIAHEIISRGVAAMPQQQKLEHNFNTVFQSLSDSAPKDSTEAKLCVQSTVLFAQGMRLMQNAESCSRIDHSEYYMKNAIKLLRLHNETIEALGKYRRGGEQRVVVQHVQVNDGGQAIVGGLFNGGGSKQ